jgi:MELT motif
LTVLTRLFPQPGTPAQTPSPKKGVGFSFDGTPSTDGDVSPQTIPHTPSPTDLPRAKMQSPGSDGETSMDIADDNLTLPLPSALIRQQMQRGVGFLVDDGDSDDDDMDVTEALGGIIPARDGVNRFLSGDDQTMEFTGVFGNAKEDDTVGMDFTRVVGKIQGLPAGKENLPPQQQGPDDDSIP